MFEYIRQCINIILVFIFIFAGSTIGANYGKIAGSVVDQKTGEPLIGANVIVKGTELGAATDDQGRFYILQVPPGTYSIQASYIGYNQTTVTEVEVRPDLTTRLQIELVSKALQSEAITVVAEKSMVQKDITSTQRSVTRDDIESTPGIEQVSDIFKSQAGMVIQDRARQIQIGEGITLEAKDPSLKSINIRGSRGGDALILIDGVPSSHPVYGGFDVMDINVENIKNIEIITGAFSAEYGQTQSAVINITTRSGSQKHRRSLKYRTDELGIWGPSYSKHRVALSLSGPEPIFKNLGINLPGKLTYFFTSTLNVTNTPYNNGRTREPLIALPLDNWGIRNSNLILMDERQNNKANYNLRLDYRPTSNISTMLSIRNSTKRWTEFKWLWKDVPNHMQEYQRNTGQYQFKLTHTLSEGTFYTLNLGYISTDYISTNNGREPNDFWVINKDTVYSTIGAPDRNPVTGFFDQESYETSWVNNYNEDYSIQLDLTSQILPSHQLKAGFNIHFKDLSNVNIINGASLSDYGVYLYENGIKYPKPPGPYKPFGLNRWVINGSPKTGGLYITDKFERETLIINIGIRADWYMPGSPTNNDEWKNQWKITTGLKPDWPKIHYQVDPRLGVSFPISPVTTMYFSYGHFNKFPGFENILRDPYSGGFTGNPHLSPVKTVKFEYGFTHEFPNKWAIDIKNYTKETSGQIGTTTLKAEYGLPVYMHDNKGFSRARGLEFEIRKETERFFRSNATYTLQWASGYSSSAFDDYRRSLNNLPNPIRERRLDWDVRHQVIIRASINVPANKNPSILGLKLPSNWNASLLSRLSSGQPYTPGAHNPVKRRKLHNTKTGPPSYRTDLRFEKGFIVNGLQFSAGLSIKNIFNQYNVNIHRGFNVWTGEPYQYGDRVQDTHRYYDYYDINRLLAPDRFGTGRHVDLTLEMLW